MPFQSKTGKGAIPAPDDQTLARRVLNILGRSTDAAFRTLTLDNLLVRSGITAQSLKANKVTVSNFIVAVAGSNFSIGLGKLGYAQVTANQGSIGTAQTDLTGLSVTITVAPSRRIRITGFCLFQASNANQFVNFQIQEGATILQVAQVNIDPGGGTAINSTVNAVAVLTPTGGSHTYKLTAAAGIAASTITMSAGATFPAFILVEDIGL